MKTWDVTGHKLNSLKPSYYRKCGISSHEHAKCRHPDTAETSRVQTEWRRTKLGPSGPKKQDLKQNREN